MLAIQRPSMGSSKPPDHELPFGYEFSTDTSFPFPTPIAPAPGPSLLDDNESRFLDSFFDGVNSDQLDYDFFMNAENSFLHPGWQELPPAFMGTTSSFGQHPPAQNHLTSSGTQDMNFNGMDGHIGIGTGMPATTSTDILAAATLLQNGSSGRAHNSGSDVMFGMGREVHAMPSINSQTRPQSITLFTSPRSRSTQDLRRASEDNYMRGESFYTDVVFGSSAQAADDMTRSRKPANPKVEIRWGSDVGFGTDQGFVPPRNQETIEEVEREHIERLKEFTADLISPINAVDLKVKHNSEGINKSRNSSPSSTHQRRKSLGRIPDENDSSRPQKRRKSKYKDEDDEDAPIPATLGQTSSARKRKTIPKASSVTVAAHSPNGSPAASADNSNRKRKSASAGANAAPKATRENLTEDQKRENHIKSEQKRRTLIREGFEDLGELVPGLRGGGFSKSAVLVMAADWLEELMQGNEILRGRVDSMERQG